MNNLEELRKQKLNEAKLILQNLGITKCQNDRSAWIFLALLDIKPNTSWSDAKNPLLQTYIIINFIYNNYGKEYKPNSRETIRKDTLHLFEQYMIVIRNKDDPSRATNSKNNNYSITNEALEAIRLFPSKEWEKKANQFKNNVPTLLQNHQKIQHKHKIRFSLPNGKKIELSPGQHNQLHEDIVTNFIPSFIGVDNAQVLYIGDTASSRRNEGGKLMHIDTDQFRSLGLPPLNHDKLPDLIIYDNNKKWLFLVEAVTSHGPISLKRYIELSQMFSSIISRVVFVTAFPDETVFRRYAADIAWETEVWISNNPTHMIHFNGKRFLGPHIK